MSLLTLTKVSRAFDPGVDALEAVDLMVGPGEVVGLLGPNGAGKTTLMRLALGMLHPDTGDVRLFGLDPTAEPVRARARVGYVAEDQVLPDYLRVRDVLGLHAELYERWDAAFASELVERFQLDPHQRIGTLSKGHTRRVAVVAAIAHRPDLLLLDEPASGLDPAARRELLEVALGFLAHEGSAIVFSSHHMADVERMAQRVVILQNGIKEIDRDLDALREDTVLVTLSADELVQVDEVRAHAHCLAARVREGELRALFTGDCAEAIRQVTSLCCAWSRPETGAARARSIGLEELFIELVQGRGARP